MSGRRFPSFRTMHSSHMLREGARPEVVRDNMGHANIAVPQMFSQVLRQAAEGDTSAEIAASLRLSEGTVRNYLSEVMSKLGAHNRVEAARIARMKGWL